MADPTVKMIYAADAREAEKAMIAIERRFNGIEQGLKRINQESKNASRVNPFEGMQNAANAALGPIATVAAAIGGIKKLYDDVRERGAKAFDTQKNLAASLEAMAINIDIPLKDAEAHAARISKKTGVDMNRVMASIGTAFSAKGHLGTKDAISAVETTAELVPNLGEGQDLISGATLDLRKFKPDLTSKQAQGFLMRAMVQARITQLTEMAQHGAPAITGMAMLDAGNEQALSESAGIYAAITQGMRDPHGRKSRTAGAALLMQAREFLGEGSEKLSNNQVLQSIANDREAFNAFFKGGDFKGKKRKGLQMTVMGPGGEEFSVSSDRASFERQAVPVLMNMLTPGTQEHKNWQSATAAMGDIKTTGLDWEQKHKELAESGIKKNVDLANRIGADTQSQFANDFSGASWNTMYSKLDENLQSRGVGWTSRWGIARELDYARNFGNKSPTDAAVSILEGRMAPYQQSAEQLEGLAGTYRSGSAGNQAYSAQAASNRETVEKLQGVIDLLKEANRLNGQKPINRNAQGE